MNRSLSVRIVAATILLTVASLFLFVGILNFLGVRALVQLGTANDRLAAQRLAPWLERYYQQQGTLDDAAFILGEPGGTRMMQGPMAGHALVNRRPTRDAPDAGTGPIALFNPDGRFVTGVNLPPDFTAVEPADRSGIPITAGGRVVARLYVGSMTEKRLGPLEREFLRTVRLAAGYTLLAVAAGALLLAVFISRNVVKPVRQTAAAAEAVAGGRYDVQLDVQRRDEIGALARSFSHMAEEVRSQEEKRRRFLADVAHELRTPVSLLSSQLEMIEEGLYPMDPDQLRRMNRHLGRMSRLIGDLQTLEATTTPESSGSATVHPGELLHAVTAGFEKAGADAGVSLKLDIATIPDSIPGDRVRLEQVVTNLISNGLRYAPRNSTILIGARVTADTLLCSVTDEGPGIPAEFREKVFERFFRVDPSRSRESGGSGLGLAISKEIVVRHRGRIWIEEPTAGGTRVCFTLPLK